MTKEELFKFIDIGVKAFGYSPGDPEFNFIREIKERISLLSEDYLDIDNGEKRSIFLI